jgi:putative FmdB family regulatory protein
VPLYDYQCKQCQTVTEVRHGFKDVHAAACPHCGGALTRVFHPSGIVFKGSGFYITDSRKGGGESGTPAANPAATATPAPTEAKKTEPKRESTKSDAA